MERLAAGGVDFTDVTRALEDDGIEKFAKSFEALLGVIGNKRKTLAAQSPPGHSAVFEVVDAAVARRLRAIEVVDFPNASGPAIRRYGRTTPTPRRSGIGWAG